MKALRYTLFFLMIAYWVTLFVLTHLPAVPMVGPKLSDKTAHYLAYGLLAGSLFVTWVIANPRRRWIGAIVTVLCFAYGAFDELTQPLVGRACELNDWLADAAGVLTAVVILSTLKWSIDRIIGRGAPSNRSSDADDANLAAGLPAQE